MIVWPWGMYWWRTTPHAKVNNQHTLGGIGLDIVSFSTDDFYVCCGPSNQCQHDSLVSLTQNLMFEIHGEIIKCGPGNDHYDYQGDIRAPTGGLLEVMHLSTMQQLWHTRLFVTRNDLRNLPRKLFGKTSCLQNIDNGWWQGEPSSCYCYSHIKDPQDMEHKRRKRRSVAEFNLLHHQCSNHSNVVR